MENSNGIEEDGDGRNEAASTSGYGLFDRQVTVHQFMGGGKGEIFLCFAFVWMLKGVNFIG